MSDSKKPKIFISHSTKDEAYVAKIVKLLQRIGLTHRIFCSSYPGYGVPNEANIYEYLRSQFEEYDLYVIFVHSKNYYESPVCLNEMGAAWVLKTDYTSFLLPGFEFKDMKGVVDDSRVAAKFAAKESDLKNKLNQFKTGIIDKFKAYTDEIDKDEDEVAVWEQMRDEFIDEIKNLFQQEANKDNIPQEQNEGSPNLDSNGYEQQNKNRDAAQNREISDATKDAQKNGISELIYSCEELKKAKKKPEDIIESKKKNIEDNQNLPEIDKKPAEDMIKTPKVGDIIYFGRYPQKKDTNDKEDIQWQVLAKNDNKALVISKYALDSQKYNDTFGDVTWETCTLRQWLNNTFINNAFNATEQSKIRRDLVPADKNPQYSTNPGKASSDKVFLLSTNEAEKHFTSDKTRKCVPTEYAIAQGAATADKNKKNRKATSWWWLRSPGRDSTSAVNVSDDGSIYYYGDYVIQGNVSVRPAMWIDLDD